MKGKILMAAAEATSITGKQIELMMSRLVDLLLIALEEGRFNVKPDKITQDDSGDNWIRKSYVKSIPLYETSRKRDPFAWVGLQATIYDEEDIAAVNSWEPSLYVMYSLDGEEDFGAGAFSWELNDLIEPDGRMWLFPSNDDEPGKLDSCFFVLPLTELGSEDALSRFIVKPLLELLKIKAIDELKSKNFGEVFGMGSPVFRFSKEGKRINLVPK